MKKLKRLFKKQEGFGLNEILGIAAALIVAAFIIIPELQNFAESVMTSLNSWWSDLSDSIFQTS